MVLESNGYGLKKKRLWCESNGYGVSNGYSVRVDRRSGSAWREVGLPLL
jgi:hypothetical protein